MRGLLDLNVWIALLDDAHVFSERADTWLREADASIATCPIVENGVIRIMSSPAYSQEVRLTPGEVAAHLRKACAQLDHQFWPADLSLRDEKCFDFSRLHGHRQITDAYLLALAVRHGGRMVTLDSAVPLAAVRGAAKKHLLVLRTLRRGAIGTCFVSGASGCRSGVSGTAPWANEPTCRSSKAEPQVQTDIDVAACGLAPLSAARRAMKQRGLGLLKLAAAAPGASMPNKAG